MRPALFTEAIPTCLVQGIEQPDPVGVTTLYLLSQTRDCDSDVDPGFVAAKNPGSDSVVGAAAQFPQFASGGNL